MGKKSRKSSPGPAAPDSGRAAAQFNPPVQGPGRHCREGRDLGAGGSLAARLAALRRLTGWRLWVANLATAVIIPTVLLALVEGGLRLFGYGYPTTFCLREKNASLYIDNDQFLWQFYSKQTNLRPNPFAVAVSKPPDVIRILLLGESAAAGTPEPAYNFGRILERMLAQQFPHRRFEVINAAMRGVNSHILLPVARECCARLQPDLLLVFMGNNEAVGLYAPGPHSGRLTSCPRLLRTLQWVRSTRLGEFIDPLLLRLAREGVPAEKQDDLFFQQHRVAADDPRRQAVYDNFRRNLADICRAARRAGAALVLMTVPVNLKDFPPLGSLHRAALSDPDLLRWQSAFEAGVEAEAAGRHAEATTNYQAAATLDEHFAELHFRLARCRFALGQFDQARREFALACDWDALPFRADSRLNQIVRQTARGLQDRATRLVDAERAFAEADPAGRQIPGERFFRDHVHPNFDGDYLLAKTLFPAVCEVLGARPAPAPLSRDQCAAQLAYTRVNEARIASEMVKATAFAPFTGQLEHSRRQATAEQKVVERFGNLNPADLEAASATYRAAMRQFPDDWWLPYNFARLRLLARDYPGAIQQFEAARRRLPHWDPIRLGLSAALCGAGRSDEALRLLRQLLALNPASNEIKANIAAIQAQRLRAP